MVVPTDNAGATMQTMQSAHRIGDAQVSYQFVRSPQWVGSDSSRSTRAAAGRFLFAAEAPCRRQCLPPRSIGSLGILARMLLSA